MATIRLVPFRPSWTPRWQLVGEVGPDSVKGDRKCGTIAG